MGLFDFLKNKNDFIGVGKSKDTAISEKNARGVKFYIFLKGKLRVKDEATIRKEINSSFLTYYFSDIQIRIWPNISTKNDETEIKVFCNKPTFKVTEETARIKYALIEYLCRISLFDKFTHIRPVVGWSFQILFRVIPPEDENVKELLVNSMKGILSKEGVEATTQHSEQSDSVEWVYGGINAFDPAGFTLPKPIRPDIIDLNAIVPLELIFSSLPNSKELDKKESGQVVNFENRKLIRFRTLKDKKYYWFDATPQLSK